MLESLRYDKGLGNAAVYARIPNAGQFWDFVGAAWAATETADCKLFMTEFADSSEVSSWYYVELTPPDGGPYSIEIVQDSTDAVIGNDITSSLALIGPGTVKCADLITTAARQLQDTANLTFPKAILLIYLNYAVREIVDLKPEANPVTGLISLVAGTKQTVPAAWNCLIDAKRNMGSSGTTPGLAITQISQQLIDSFLPDWHTWPTNAVVRHIIINERDPYSFDVLPPQPTATTQKIEAEGSAYPGKATDPVNDDFPLPDQYEVPTVDYMIYRALNESTTIPNALAKGNAHLQKFYQWLGVKTQVEDKVNSEEK